MHHFSRLKGSQSRPGSDKIAGSDFGRAQRARRVSHRDVANQSNRQAGVQRGRYTFGRPRNDLITLKSGSEVIPSMLHFSRLKGGKNGG